MTAMLRCASYARFSSDLQKATSLDDQLAAARRYAESQGWQWLAAHVYTDAAISGASLERPGISALRQAAQQKPRPFDVVLVDDSSRVSRDLADAVRLLQELRFAGVRVVYISQNIDSANEQAETLVAVHGVVDSLYLREMAKKIRRGLVGQLQRGFATGGTTYGYRTVPVPDPSGKTDANGYPVLIGKRVEVVPEEARIVSLIFEWYADGLGTGRILERLHRDGLRTRRGTRWHEGAVKRLLANEKYTGKLIWGQKSFERRPGTRQYVARPNPRDQWQVQEDPALRIIPDSLWARVQARQAKVKTALPASTGHTLMRGRSAVLSSPHLFSGFMRCAVCGGAITVVSGGNGSPRYGCQTSWRNGVAHCTNRLTIRAKLADAHLLEGLQRGLTEPATVRLITDRLAAALNARIDERPARLAEAQTTKRELTQRLQRLLEAIEAGVPAQTVAPQIAERQAELARVEATLAALADPIGQRLTVMPAWVEQQLADVRDLLAQSPERTKAEFSRLDVAVSMQPTTREDGRRFYRAEVASSLPWLSMSSEMRPNQGALVDRSDPPAAR